MKNPVAARASTPSPTLLVSNSTRFAPAAPSELKRISLVGASTSDTTNTADTTAPSTKPHCTEMVSHATADADSPHSSRTCGSTAVAENQVDFSNSRVPARTSRFRRAVRISRWSSWPGRRPPCCG
jgi:hypothetical protein